MKAAVPLKHADSICLDLWGRQHSHQTVMGNILKEQLAFYEYITDKSEEETLLLQSFN